MLTPLHLPAPLTQLVQQHPAYASGRALAFVADAGRTPLAAPAGPVPAATVDYVTMVGGVGLLALQSRHVVICVTW